jgi:putative hydrolase of HD superfamily
MIDVEKLISLLQYSESLKKVDRAGWELSGAKLDRVESVAEHSFGSIISSIIIAQSLKSLDIAINIEKVVIMASLHDLPEAITGDIAKTSEFLKDQEQVKAKELAEKNAIENMIRPLGPQFEELQSIWEEFNLGQSLEARVVKGADIIDMLLHARSMEDSGTSPQNLHQFFKSSRSLIATIEIDVITEIYNLLYLEHERKAHALKIDLK